MHFNYLGLGSATLLQLAFLGESDVNFPCEKFPRGQQSVKKDRKKKDFIIILFCRRAGGAQSAGGGGQVVLLQADGPHGAVLPLCGPAAPGWPARPPLAGGETGAHAGSQAAREDCHRERLCGVLAGTSGQV